MKSTHVCKVCGGAARLLFSEHNENWVVQRIDHARCLCCGLVFVANPISDEQLGASYDTLDSGAYYAEITATTARKFQTAAAWLLRHFPDRQTRILDLGCGDGGFSRTLLRHGYERLSAHEIPGSDLEHLAERGVQVYSSFDYADLPDETFDVVTLLDVAEHVRNPASVFAEIARVLKPGGVVYLHTPVVTGIDRLMHFLQSAPGAGRIGRAWQRCRTSVFHLQNYTAAALEHLLREAGLVDFRIRRRNELSWPMRSYVRTYVCRPCGLPESVAPLLAGALYPILGTRLFNANKGIVSARKAA